MHPDAPPEPRSSVQAISRTLIAAILAAMTFPAKVSVLLDAGYSPRELAKLTGTSSPRVVRGWAQGSQPRKLEVTERVDDLFAIVSHLVRTTGYSVADIVGWTRSRNPDLRWRTPLDCLRDPGQFESVLAATVQLGRPPADAGAVQAPVMARDKVPV